LKQQREEKKKKETDSSKRKFEEELDEINNLILIKETQLNIAQDMISEGNILLNSAMLAKTLKKEDVAKAQAKISLGLEQSASGKMEINKLHQRKEECDKKKSILKTRKH
jgi:hypothetical protein